MDDSNSLAEQLDSYTSELFKELYAPVSTDQSGTKAVGGETAAKISELVNKADHLELTAPIIDLFVRLKGIRDSLNLTPDSVDISKDTLLRLAVKHQNLDEHGVSVGGRVTRALNIVKEADKRVKTYMETKAKIAPSGIELWDKIQENANRIQSILNMKDEEWHSYSGQIRNCIDSAQQLSEIINLPAGVIEEVARVTKNYRMRLTPYYASLIQSQNINDPVLLQCVPTGEMVDNVGVEIPPVAADHSPARLIDQFYPRVLTIKATNMCAMYCTHCLRIAHIGKKDRIYSDQAYEEALTYIRNNSNIRDVLITGGDAFVLPNKIIKKILNALDQIDHVKMKRLGTRIPVTTPWRVDSELLDILDQSNEIKPVRVVTQINTAQEITPVSKDAFKRISKSVTAVLNQAVLLKGINDTRVKMWKLCETIHESYVRPYYVFNCSYRNPQFTHFRVPVEKGRDIIESMYGNITGDAIPRYIATAGGKIPLHRSNVVEFDGQEVILKKPWNNEEVRYPDADRKKYDNQKFSFAKTS